MQLPINNEFALNLLRKVEEEPVRKRGKFTISQMNFVGEDDVAYKNRLTFVLEVLLSNENVIASAKLLLILFDLVKELVFFTTVIFSHHCYYYYF